MKSYNILCTYTILITDMFCVTYVTSYLGILITCNTIIQYIPTER